MDYNIIKNGGEKISEGGYGCVYHPALRCDGSEMSNRKYISKLQINDYAGKNEIKISELIKKIQYYKDFFVPILSHCKINKTEMTNGMIEKCEPLKNKKGLDVLLMKMDYINGDTLYNYLASIESPKQLIHEIIHTYNYLTESVSMLLKHGIIHYDLKSPNIMYSNTKHIPYIIDFGLSIDIKKAFSNKQKLKETFYVYAPDYYIWCPEIHMLNYMMNVSDTLNVVIIKSICNDVVKYNNVFNRIYNDNEIKVHLDALTKYYVDLFTSLDEDSEAFMEFLLGTYDSWDNYSLSLMYLNILLLLKKNRKKSAKDSYFIKLFSQLLVHNVSFNPKERYNILKLDEYMLTEMYQHKNQHDDGKRIENKTEKYIDGFMEFLQEVSTNHDDIQKSLRLEEEEIVRVSKSIERL